MKRTWILIACLCASLFLTATATAGENKTVHSPIRVAVFEGHGGSPGCVIDAVESLRIDPDMIVSIISADDILNGKLELLDALVIPGGSGSRQYSNLGELGIAEIRRFVTEKGNGIVGLCAGSYFLSDTPDYVCMRLVDYEATDIAHDNRGHGTIAFKLNEKGTAIFPELADRDISYLHYYEGPLLVPNDPEKVSGQVLSTMISDVHLKNDAPAGMTPGKPLFINGTAGKGRYFAAIGHPENTPGMRWMTPRMVRWVLNKPLVSYPDTVVRPDIYDKEILFDKETTNREDTCFGHIVYGDEDRKIEGINTLTTIKSFSFRNYLPGLLRDSSPDVRLAAAKAALELERTEVIPDLATVIRLEADPAIKKNLQTCLAGLKSMVGKK